MRKVLYLFTLLGLLANVADAQIQVIHGADPASPNGQTQNYAGTNVTVTRSGSRLTNQCNTGPYSVGNGFRGSVNFGFNAPVTHVIVSIMRLHEQDTIAFNMNGSPVTLSPSDLGPYASSCALTGAPIATSFGHLTSDTKQGPTTANGTGTQIVFTSPNAPFTINNFTVQSLTGPNSNGIVFTLEFLANDTCNLPFNITASDSTPCSGRCVDFRVPKYPNTTFTWTKAGTVIGAFPLPGAKIDTSYQQICPVSNIYLGEFIARGVRGACAYEDTIFLTPKTTPTPLKVTRPLFPNGICRGGKDSLQATAPLAVGGDYYWYRKNPSRNIKGQPDPIYKTSNGSLIIEDFVPTDEGDYCAFALSSEECYSDTACLNVNMLPDVIADFDVFPLAQTCDIDTALITNNSTGATNGYIWRFWDYKDVTTGNPVGVLPSRTDDTKEFKQIYQVPKPNNTPPREYIIELVAMNSACRDSIRDSVTFHHPLTAGFKVNKDTVCQGVAVDTVFFTDTTTESVAGLHQYLWKFGEPGSPTSTDENGLKWLYTKTGTWRAMLTVTDYQGCVDSAWRDIFVDSTGPLFFSSTDTVVCAGQQVAFAGDLNRVGLRQSFWDFGNGLQITDSSSTVFNFDVPGTYIVSFNATYRVCPDAVAEVPIRVKPFPIISLGPDTSMCQFGQPIRLWDRINHPSTPGLTWRWNTPSGRDTGPALVVRHPGVYAATVTKEGCSTTDSITVAKNCYLDIPNVFTPDGDGNNDYFLPRQLLGRSIAKFKMVVYNRYGQKVYEASSTNGRGWDGNFNAEKQPSGVYVYQLEVAFSDNASRLEKYEGNVTLLR